MKFEKRRKIFDSGSYNINKSVNKCVYFEGKKKIFETSYNGKPGVGNDINETELKLKKITGILTTKSTRKDPFEKGKGTKIVPGAGFYKTISNQSHKFYFEYI